MVELDKLKRILPQSSRRNVTQSMVDKINTLTANDGEEFSEQYRENFMGYLNVMKNGEYKISDYMNAVRYCSYKLMEYSNIDSYMLTFPDRYNTMIEKYAELGDEDLIRSEKISSFVSMYNKNKLVNLIMDQSMVPNHIINAPLYQKALNRQAHLMMHASSELVQTQAANSILTHLKPPETIKMEIDIGIKENDAIAELRKVTQELAAMQHGSIVAGISTPLQIAESKIINAEIVSNDE